LVNQIAIDNIIVKIFGTFYIWSIPHPITMQKVSMYGIFATRAPARPNPIGISIVRLVRVEGKKLFIRDVDIIDGTPLLDIKPYVPEFDIPEFDIPEFDVRVKIGWLEKNVSAFDRITGFTG
jgi:tRNA (Thr-GGU) A37 N-methylase